MLLQRGERNFFQRCLVRGLKDHGRSHVGQIGLKPPRRTQAPSIARSESRKVHLRDRCGEVITLLPGKGEEIGCHFDADRVRTDILGARVAAAIAIKTCPGFLTAILERTAQHVARCLHPPNHGFIPSPVKPSAAAIKNKNMGQVPFLLLFFD